MSTRSCSPGLVVFQLTKRTPTSTAWSGWWPWVVSLAVFLLWVAGGIAWAPGFYEQVVLKEFAGRFDGAVHRAQPFYFYLPHLLHKFAPWSVLALALAVVSWKSERLAWRERWQRLEPGTAWLICWIFGGLLIMSLIPSKRVDRIFPIVPPLCLLLAAQAATLLRRTETSGQVRRWSGIALLVACLGTSVYAGERIWSSFRGQENALAQFGRAVRADAKMKGWRYGVIGGPEEGLLLYLRRSHFLNLPQAIEQWHAGQLDALVVPAAEAAALRAALPNAEASALEGTVTINDQARRYLWFTRGR